MTSAQQNNDTRHGRINKNPFLAALVIIGVIGAILINEFRLGGLNSPELWQVLAPGFVMIFIALVISFRRKPSQNLENPEIRIEPI